MLERLATRLTPPTFLVTVKTAMRIYLNHKKLLRTSIKIVHEVGIAVQKSVKARIVGMIENMMYIHPTRFLNQLCLQKGVRLHPTIFSIIPTIFASIFFELPSLFHA